MPTEYELERERNIARNKALLEQLQLKQAVESLVPVKAKAANKSQAKPVQSRQSARLRTGAVDPNESPSKRKRREVRSKTIHVVPLNIEQAELEERRAIEAEERMEAEERARLAKRARHTDLDLTTLAENEEEADITALSVAMNSVSQNPRRVRDEDAYQSEDEEDDNLITELREKLEDLKVVSRANAAYHPESHLFRGQTRPTGHLGCKAGIEEVVDEDGDVAPAADQEGGGFGDCNFTGPPPQIVSSISCVKIDPIDSHNIYTTSYDCTVRSLNFTSGVSREIFSIEDTLISSIDLTPSGHEMWISDALGGVWHRDLRQDKSTTIRYGLSDQKIGCISVNPTRPNFLLTASNNRSLKIWDVRKLQTISLELSDQALPTPPLLPPEAVTEFLNSKKGKGCLRGDWRHDKSVSSAYWDRHSYDDSLRLWDIEPVRFESPAPFPSSRPFHRIRHNCQTGKWLTILRAQWSPNPDAYPHFTIGNMDHSLDIFSCKGDLITKLSDRSKISAVQAVTCSHPSIVERAVSGNASGRCVLWAPSEETDEADES
ncbi:WD40-repeat-containing domain protein [Mycena galopus ATCC 62051]|nr:WD40-repeat-containing domain protein [Mycena galopus ATCC 62051]